ncbi:Basic endochitinase, partial [Termitomyces sp. T112]
MVSFTSLLTFAVSALFSVQSVVSTAINEMNYATLGNEAQEILSLATPVPPHWVIYWDQWTGDIGPPDVSAISGFNVFTLCFLLIEGAWDQAQEWTTLTDAQRATIKSQYAAAGIKLIVSVFGATDAPTSTGADPVETANTFAAW